MKASAGFKLGLTRTSLSDVDAYTRIVVYASLSSAHVFATDWRISYPVAKNKSLARCFVANRSVVNFRLRCEWKSKWTWKSIPSSVIVVDNSDQQLPSTRFVFAELAGVCRRSLLTRPVIDWPASVTCWSHLWRIFGQDFECCRRDRLPVSSTVYLLDTMADHRLENTTRITDSSQAAKIGSSTISTSGPATRILSSETSAMARFSLESTWGSQHFGYFGCGYRDPVA